MSKQQPAERSAKPEKSATGLMDVDATDAAELGTIRQDHQQAKQAQKGRLGGLDRETLLDLYHKMLLVRRFEEKSAEAYSMGKIGGFCHLYIGQAAVAIGSISAIRQDDYVLTSYREHAHAIAKGISSEAVMAELFGKSAGCSH